MYEENATFSNLKRDKKKILNSGKKTEVAHPCYPIKKDAVLVHDRTKKNCVKV